jgi:hypothetical protein
MRGASVVCVGLCVRDDHCLGCGDTNGAEKDANSLMLSRNKHILYPGSKLPAEKMTDPSLGGASSVMIAANIWLWDTVMAKQGCGPFEEAGFLP